jgi:hypothetical protein
MACPRGPLERIVRCSLRGASMPPANTPDLRIRGEDTAEHLCNAGHGSHRGCSCEEPQNSRLGCLDEAKEAIWVLLVVPAADPNRQGGVRDWKTDSPIFEAWFAGRDTANPKLLAEVLGQAKAMTPRVDLLFLAGIGRKLRGPKLNVRKRLH